MTLTTQTPKLPRQAVTKGRQTETIELAKTRPAEKTLNGKNAPSYFAPFATKLNSVEVVSVAVSVVAAEVNVVAAEVAVNAEAVVSAADKTMRKI